MERPSLWFPSPIEKLANAAGGGAMPSGGELVTNPGPQGLLGCSETALGIVGSGIQQTLNAAKSSKNLMGLKLFWVGYLGRAA